MPASLRPFLKSIPVSFVCFLLDYGLLWVLTEKAGWYYLVSAALSFMAANSLNYWICYRWVFPVRERSGLRYPFFLVVGAVGLGLNVALMALFTGLLQWHYMVSKVAAATMVFFWNYWLRRYAVFR